MITTYKFSGHESFPCKSLWLKKGYDFVMAGKDFNAPNSVIDLGVGKNMVSAIRYWLKAFGISNSEGGITELGHYLFDNEKGRDKYIEDLATLWLLHFLLITTKEATLYNMFFCSFQRERLIFEKEQLVDFVKVKLIEAGKQNAFNRNTVIKDIGVLLQNYILPRKSLSNEDYSSLLIDLDIVRLSNANKNYIFNIEGKRKVPEEIFLYALLTIKGNDNTIAYEDIKKDVGNPFCMTDGEVILMLKKLAKRYSENIAYSDNAGIRQVQFCKNISPFTVLDDYYEHI